MDNPGFIGLGGGAEMPSMDNLPQSSSMFLFGEVVLVLPAGATTCLLGLCLLPWEELLPSRTVGARLQEMSVEWQLHLSSSVIWGQKVKP